MVNSCSVFGQFSDFLSDGMVFSNLRCISFSLYSVYFWLNRDVVCDISATTVTWLNGGTTDLYSLGVYLLTIPSLIIGLMAKWIWNFDIYW